MASQSSTSFPRSAILGRATGLIVATGFYEYTAPEAPKIKLKDQHFFTMKGEEWFWVAGIVKDNCFTMPENELLATPPPGRFKVVTVRKDGIPMNV